jgi:hypothetical protein
MGRFDRTPATTGIPYFSKITIIKTRQELLFGIFFPAATVPVLKKNMSSSSAYMYV